MLLNSHCAASLTWHVPLFRSMLPARAKAKTKPNRSSCEWRRLAPLLAMVSKSSQLHHHDTLDAKYLMRKFHMKGTRSIAAPSHRGSGVGVPTLVHYDEYDFLYASIRQPSCSQALVLGTARQPPIDFPEWHAAGF